MRENATRVQPATKAPVQKIDRHKGRPSSEAGMTAAFKRAESLSRKPVGSQPATGHLSNHNHKLGHGILSWEMTPLAACPGCKHALCSEQRPDGKGPWVPMCFGSRGHYRRNRMKAFLDENFQFAQSARFVPWVNNFLSRRRHVRAVRMPGVGDLFSIDFISKVLAIVLANPKIKFWCYTRVWCMPELWAEVQQKLKGLPNMTIWCSTDRKMHARYGTPGGDLPWCWLAETDDDVPPMHVDLVWRYDSFSYWNYQPPLKRAIGGCVVCPHEDGVTTTTCSSCGLCWRGTAFRKAKIARLLRPAEEITVRAAGKR